MANRKPKQTQAQKQYAQQVKRIKQFISRASKRGFRFNFTIPQKPTRITKASVKKLQKIKPELLYKKATYLDPESGKVVSGLQGRKIERRLSAQKAVLTRKQKKEAPQQSVPQLPFIGDIILDNIRDMIRQVKRDHNKAGQSLENLLNREISKYGKDKVAQAISQAPESAIETAEIALRYNPGSGEHDTAIREFSMIITGEIPSIEEAKQLQEDLAEDYYYDV